MGKGNALFPNKVVNPSGGPSKAAECNLFNQSDYAVAYSTEHQTFQVVYWNGGAVGIGLREWKEVSTKWDNFPAK